MRRLSHVAAVLAGAAGLAASASAQSPPGATIAPACHSTAELAEMLDQKFAEHRSAIGLQADGHLVEVFASKDGATWTIVVTRPDGWSCIVAVGEHWESLPGRLTGPLA